jgi:cytochrome c
MADEGPAGNASNGKKIFSRNCANCHNVAVKGKHQIGPMLGTVFGRKIASIKGFKFSAGMAGKKAQSWDAELMDKWLTNPSAFSAGTTMAFVGLK